MGHCVKLFYQMSFTFDLNETDGDDIYFAYCFPYTFTRLTRFLKQLKSNPAVMKLIQDSSPLCSSLSGIDVPFLTITQPQE